MSAFDSMIEVDHQLFFFLNGLHQNWLDPVMNAFSNWVFWLPIYIWLTYLIVKKFGKGAIIILLCAAALVFFSDQTANVFKALVQRFRPTHNPSFGQLVHTVNNYRGGLYGFFSSHATNAFAVVIFVLLLLKPSQSYIKWICIGYACITSYSRIYLGVHYPADILVGALTGLGLGFLFSNFTKVLLEKWNIKFQS